VTHSYLDIAFTRTVRDLQSRAGSRTNYAAMGDGNRHADRLTARETAFVTQRDSFYMASVSESGWPYVQHRGGPRGFVKVLDDKTLAFADYAGNYQYISTGNLMHDDRVSLLFMDYPNRRRLKMFGRIRIVGTEDTVLIGRVEAPDYPAQAERAFVITVEGYDWNCPSHITPRFAPDEMDKALDERARENRRVGEMLDTNATPGGVAGNTLLGEGPIELVVTGVRQLTPEIRAFELRRPGGEELPVVTPGAHLQLPVRLPSGEITTRSYSIASNPARRDAWEIAVLREAHGSGGSAALHAGYALGTRIRVDRPANHFGLHEDDRPAVLIAGGIGITPIKSMAQALDGRGTDFHLHYAGRGRDRMAYRDRLERQLGKRISIYSKADGERLDAAAVLGAAADDAWVYLCGPDRLVAGVIAAARAVGFPRDRLRLERFS
jgi:ferredoxin-NADP reductase/predicted pyridoxine 5'-phosphate oxidase superfamily flavin-nucleotide-binding protein